MKSHHAPHGSHGRDAAAQPLVQSPPPADEGLLPQQSPRRDRSRGFSLIELLIVVAIILIIAAIAIPNFLRARMAANEAAAVAACRKITTANVVYSTSYGRGYAVELVHLGPPPGGGTPGPLGAELLDAVLVAGSKHGYVFTYLSQDDNSDGIVDSFTINAAPANPGVTGDRYFFTDQSGVIRANPTEPATAADTPI